MNSYGQHKRKVIQPCKKELVSVRYMVNDVPSAVDFYSKHFGFTGRHQTTRPSPMCTGETCGIS